MRQLVARRRCRAEAPEAWAALLDIPRWLTAIDSVDGVEVADEVKPGEDRGGRGRFLVQLSERLTMEHQVAELVPEERLAMTVRWRRLLRIDYIYEIEPRGEACELVHVRAYRGPVTRALATIWRGREEEEQAAVLREWCWEAGSIAAVRRYAS